MQFDFRGQKYACPLTVMLLKNDSFLRSYSCHQMQFCTWEGLSEGLIFHMLKELIHTPKSC